MFLRMSNVTPENKRKKNALFFSPAPKKTPKKKHNSLSKKTFSPLSLSRRPLRNYSKHAAFALFSLVRCRLEAFHRLGVQAGESTRCLKVRKGKVIRPLHQFSMRLIPFSSLLHARTYTHSILKKVPHSRLVATRAVSESLVSGELWGLRRKAEKETSLGVFFSERNVGG